VTSKPTTEANGASSPVTNTAGDCEDGVVDEFEPAPQLAPNIESASKRVIPRNRFMANSNSKI